MNLGDLVQEAMREGSSSNSPKTSGKTSEIPGTPSSRRPEWEVRHYVKYGYWPDDPPVTYDENGSWN